METKRKLRIVIDPGHGGKDPGAVYGGIREADINLQIGTELAAMLEESGHAVTMTRKTDEEVSLLSRCKVSNGAHHDLFLSIHANAATNTNAKGMEIWTSPGQTEADAAASAIIGALEKAFPGMPVRLDLTDGDPDHEGRFFVLIHTHAPAALVELGFVSSPEDRAFLTSKSSQTDIAAVIANALEAWGNAKQT